MTNLWACAVANIFDMAEQMKRQDTDGTWEWVNLAGYGYLEALMRQFAAMSREERVPAMTILLEIAQQPGRFPKRCASSRGC